MLEDLSPDLMLKSAIPLDAIHLVRHNGISVIWLDISERPDFSVVAARHEQESGYASCTWFYVVHGKQNITVGLRIEMRQPTRTVFHLAFKLERYFTQLSTIAKYGKLWMVPGPPPAYLVRTQIMDVPTFLQTVVNYSGQGILIELEPPLVKDLQAQLEMWKRTR